MHYTFAPTVILTALATARSGAAKCGPHSTTVSQSDEFTLAMTVNGSLVSLTAVSNGTTELVLQSGDPSVALGSPGMADHPAPLNYDTAVILDFSNSTDASIPPGAYGLSAPDLGENYGVATNVFAIKNVQDFSYFASNGTIYHQATAAPQSWFACLDTNLNGTQKYFLRWGVFAENGSAPYSCGVTTLFQNFNVPTGASPPA